MADVVLATMLVAVACAVSLLARRALGARRRSAHRWRLAEASRDGYVYVFAERIGTTQRPEIVPISKVAWTAPDFEFKLELLRSEGLQKVVALNSGGPR